MNGGLRLVEREVELAALEGALARAVDGEGSVLAIRGVAGVGKTSLVQAAADRAAAHGMRTFEATGGRLEIDFSFGVARQLFEHELARADPTERARLLAGPARLAARALAEHGGPKGADDPTRPDPASGLAHGLYWLVANLAAEAAAVLLVDDLQWCDAASLHFLVYLARRVSDLPVLLVVATRPDDHPGDQPAFVTLGELMPRTVLEPGPLTDAGVQAMLGGATPAPTELARRVHTETGGNPFLVGELARALADGADWADGPAPAPQNVTRSIRSRVGVAGPDAESLAGAVAVLGDGCTQVEAAAVADLQPDAAAAAALDLVRAGILAVERSGVRFVHPLIRTAIEDGMPEPLRAHRHARAARVLTDLGADDERIAVQLMRTPSGGDSVVAARLARAGRDALSRGAPQAAARFLQRAVDEGPEPDELGALLSDLGTALVLAGSYDGAAAVLRQAHDAATGEAELVARTTALWMALTGLGSAAVPEGVQLLESTLARVQDRESRMMLESEFVNVAFLDPSRLAATWTRLEPYAELAGDTPAERRLLSMVTIKAQHVTESAPVVAETARRAYGDGLLIDENQLDSTKWIWAVGALVLTDQLELAESALHRGALAAAATGSLQTLLVAADLRALLWLRRGRVGDTDAETIDALGHLGDTVRTPVLRSLEIALVRWRLQALVALGRLQDADDLLARHGLAGDLPPGARQIRLHHERGLVRLAQHRPADALDEVARLAEFHRRHGIESVVDAPWRTVAARALAATRDAAGAIETADEHLALARQWALPRDVGVALRVRAQVETDLERRIELFEQSVAALHEAPAPLERAETATRLGVALRRIGRRTEARAALDEGLALSSHAGALAVWRRARDEIRLLGGEPRSRAVSGAASLTPGERRIALLAAQGLSNREIAQELFLSVRTAENTLRRVYQKLHITSRRELGAAMATDVDS